MKSLSFLLVILSINIFCQDNIKEQLLKAEQLINNRQYTEAVEYLQKIISENPLNQEAHYYLGQAYYKPLFVEGLKMQNIDLHPAMKASRAFKKVIEISPYYTGKIFVQDPYSKIQTIWGSMAMNYILKDKPDSARWAFEFGKSQGGFSESMLEHNKNILAGCDKDAIIFTSGDDDTFPIWFLQYIEGYRKDITIVNVHLLNVPWYIKQLKNGYPFGINNIYLNIPDDEIDNIRPVKWEETEIELAVNDPLNKENKITWLLKPTYESKALLVRDQMIVEILKANNWERPVYFTAAVDEEYQAGLSEYLTFEGLVRKVNSHKEKISPEKIYNNITEIYTYDNLNPDVMKVYLKLHLTLADYYYNAGEKTKAKEILSLLLENFSEEIFDSEIKNEFKELNKKISE